MRLVAGQASDLSLHLGDIRGVDHIGDRVARNRVAARLPLAPGVLCPNGILEGIARAAVGRVEDLRQVEGMREWQRQVLGAELLAASASGA